jgi:CheY-like chemotaxis protein
MSESLNILLIDDDADTQNIFRIAAEFRDHHLTVAGNGQNGLAALRNSDPDIVVIDLVLPDMDGYKVFDRIHESNLAPHATFVAITAYHTADTTHRTTSHGFDGFLPKPLWSSQLMQRLEEIADQ